GSTPWVGVHTKRDLILLQQVGVTIPAPAGDAELAAYLLNPARRIFEMADLAREKLGVDLREYAAIAGSGKERRPFVSLDPQVAGDWLAQSAACAMEVERRLQGELAAAGLEALYRELEVPVTVLLAEMEHHGVRLDVDALRAFAEEI